MNFSGQTKIETLSVLVLANKYCLQELEKSLIEYIKNSILSIRNVCEIYNFAVQYLRDELKASCMELIMNNPKDFLSLSEFLILPAHDFAEIISMDSMSVPEKDIFLAVKLWLEKNTNVKEQNKKELLNAVR